MLYLVSMVNLRHLIFWLSWMNLVLACTGPTSHQPYTFAQTELQNSDIRNHAFLSALYGDDFYPTIVVDDTRAVLITFCERIEMEQPQDLEALYTLSHEATQAINALVPAYDAAGSELETVAREAIAADMSFIAQVYGFDAEIEALIAPRTW